MCASRAFVCLFVLYVFVFIIFLLLSGLAAICDCSTPWIFLLTFFVTFIVSIVLHKLPDIIISRWRWQCIVETNCHKNH